jgi:hypothetical protein
MLTHDAARRIAAKIAKLPELLGRSAQPMVGLMPNEPEALIEWGKCSARSDSVISSLGLEIAPEFQHSEHGITTRDLGQHEYLQTKSAKSLHPDPSR